MELRGRLSILTTEHDPYILHRRQLPRNSDGNGCLVRHRVERDPDHDPCTNRKPRPTIAGRGHETNPGGERKFPRHSTRPAETLHSNQQSWWCNIYRGV